VWTQKGDVDCPSHKSEAKITGKKQYTLKKDDLDKIREEALRVGKKPVLFISFGNNPRPTWAVIEFNDFLEAYNL
jgi:hypothetical protein